MLDYVKAMSDPNRLRIIGLLSQKSATRDEIAKRLKLSPKDSLTHVGFLEFMGVITQVDGVFSLNDENIAALAREKLAETRRSYVPDDHWDEKSKKVLKAHLDADGSIKQIPAQPKLQVILNYLVEFFEFDKNYTEKDVNTILRKYNEDTAGLRRGLVDAGMLNRESDGSRYWRVKATTE